jgi:hypothetical protein
VELIERLPQKPLLRNPIRIFAIKRPCMGGWCSTRDHCVHYWVTSPIAPAERLCMKGDRNAFAPIVPADPVGPSQPASTMIATP